LLRTVVRNQGSFQPNGRRHYQSGGEGRGEEEKENPWPVVYPLVPRGKLPFTCVARSRYMINVGNSSNNSSPWRFYLGSTKSIDSPWSFDRREIMDNELEL